MNITLDRPLLHPLVERAAHYAAASRGKRTTEEYAAQWESFLRWCEEEDFDALSGAATVALHITAMADAGYSYSTINVRLAAIQAGYREADVPLNMADMALAPVRDGITRMLGTAPQRKVAPVTPEVLRPMLAACKPPAHPKGARDRLLLLLGFGAALRRSELVGLRLPDVRPVPGKGLRVTIRRSKTDQIGAGQVVYVTARHSEPETCALAAFRQWLAHRGDKDGPLLCAVHKSGQLSGHHLTDKVVALVVKASAEAAGFNPVDFAGHSLRRGLLTAAAHAGGDMATLMNHARHTRATTTSRYIQEAHGFDERNASNIAWGN